MEVQGLYNVKDLLLYQGCEFFVVGNSGYIHKEHCIGRPKAGKDRVLLSISMLLLNLLAAFQLLYE